jgi:hypothetical protein
MAKMGLQFGLDTGKYCKRQNRWLFYVPEVSADETAQGVNALPPEKSARPNLNFKEMEVKHLIEDVFYPCKPDWKPINLVLFDLKKQLNPVFKWIKEVYDPQQGQFYPPNSRRLIKECWLTLYDGCGTPIEQWIFEDAWPQSVNFQQLDMTQSGVLMCDITLRYTRAYILEG